MGKAALVTGGSGGIGQAVCLKLAQDGYDVAVHYRSGAEQAKRVCAQIEAMGRRAVAVPADLSDPAECKRLVQLCVDSLGGIFEIGRAHV